MSLQRASDTAAVGAVVAGAASAALPQSGRRSTRPAILADLYDERFVDALPRTSLATIAARLADRGVLATGASGKADKQSGSLRDAERHLPARWRFDIDRVHARAAEDALIAFDHSLYAETEFLLYTFVARLFRPG